MNKLMKIAKENAEKGIENKEGGPFGAVICLDRQKQHDLEQL